MMSSFIEPAKRSGQKKGILKRPGKNGVRQPADKALGFKPNCCIYYYPARTEAFPAAEEPYYWLVSPTPVLALSSREWPESDHSDSGWGVLYAIYLARYPGLNHPVQFHVFFPIYYLG